MIRMPHFRYGIDTEIEGEKSFVKLARSGLRSLAAFESFAPSGERKTKALPLACTSIAGTSRFRQPRR